jgi:hypothetical protein
LDGEVGGIAGIGGRAAPDAPGERLGSGLPFAPPPMLIRAIGADGVAALPVIADPDGREVGIVCKLHHRTLQHRAA